MVVPSCCANDDVTLGRDSRANIREDCVGSRELNADVNISQCFRSDFVSNVEDARNCLALFSRDRVNLASHFAESDDCDLHANSFRASLSYRSMPSNNSRLLILSPAECASRIDPGPMSSRLPVLP